MSGKDWYYNHMNAAADTLLPLLQTPQVRDLAWACFSPPMLDCALLGRTDTPIANCALSLTAERRRWLQELDRDAAPLIACLGDTREGRLGVYFERLWQFFLDSDPAVALVAHNLPVHEKGRTLGEFDCIYYCRQRQCHVHLELAVKFYLQRPGADGGEWRDWVGPNLADRLDHKLQRLFRHQLLLGDSAAARPVLSRLGIDTLQRELEIKGRLFAVAHGTRLWPPACPPGTPGLRYYSLKQLHSEPLHAARYSLLSRQRWFAPVVSGCAAPGYTAKELGRVISSRFDLDARPVQVAECDANGRECGRFFVVPEDWPSQAQGG